MENETFLDEELARMKIRQWVNEEKEGRQNSFWKVINAPIFLWLISSILLSGLVFCTSLISDHFAEKRELQETLRNLRVELSYRMDPVVLAALYTQSEDGIFVNIGAVQTWCLTPKFNAEHSIAISPTNPSIQVVATPGELSPEQRQILLSRFIFSKFEGRSIFSLLWELENKTTNGTERTQVHAATEAINLMRGIVVQDGILSPETSIVPIETLKAAWKNGNWAPQQSTKV